MTAGPAPATGENVSFVFYDLETTGLSPEFDQALQFAAVRTDDDFNEVDSFQLRCRLSPHIVPSPGALVVNRVTPTMLTDSNLPSYYEALRAVREKFVEWSPAIFIGYSSISFDEDFLRQGFFQTLQPIYLTNTAGNARGDIVYSELGMKAKAQKIAQEYITTVGRVPWPEAHALRKLNIHADAMYVEHVNSVV